MLRVGLGISCGQYAGALSAGDADSKQATCSEETEPWVRMVPTIAMPRQRRPTRARGEFNPNEALRAVKNLTALEASLVPNIWEGRAILGSIVTFRQPASSSTSGCASVDATPHAAP